MTHLFGQSGTFILGLVFTIACFCVSIGLVTSCSQFFANALPKINYKTWVMILAVLSTAIANLGLTQILQISVPILGMIYPIAIVMILLGLVDNFLKKSRPIYITVVIFVTLFSIIETINKTFLANQWSGALGILPFYTEGIGWIIPALLGLIVGYVLGMFSEKTADV